MLIIISFFTGIERNTLSKILITLKPFIVVETLEQGTSKSLRYTLYHQSLVEFLKKEYLDDDSINSFYISEQDGHRKIIEKYYNVLKYDFKINLIKEYGLKYLPDHLFALVNCDDYEGIDWYSKLFQLAKNKEFEQKQLKYFPFETDLPLKTLKRAFEASIEKEDPVLTSEMLLIYANCLKKISSESPISILKDIDIYSDNNEFDNVLEKSWKIADLNDKETQMIWYLLIGWFLDNKNKIYHTKKTLDRLFKKDLVFATKGKHIINFLVYSLYEHYKDNVVKIFDYLSDDDIYKICSLFIENKNDKIGLEIFGFINDKNTKIKDLIEVLNRNNFDIENDLIKMIFQEYRNLLFEDRPIILASITAYLVKSNKIETSVNLFDELIQTAGEIDYHDLRLYNYIGIRFSRSISLSSISQSGKTDKAIEVAKSIDEFRLRSQALASIASLLAQSGKTDESLKLFDTIIQTIKSLNAYERSYTFSEIADL